MFSQLGPLFKTTFRHAESNDTRQNIPHEERVQERRQQEEESQQQKPEKWEDDTAVSVDALQTFLVNFLKTMPGADDGTLSQAQTPEADPLQSRPKERVRPTNTHNAKAVRAYQTMAQRAKEEAPPPPPPETNNDPTADKVQSKELRDIHALIENLETLKQRNIQTLHIKPAESFVESLKAAVAKELSQ